MSGREGQQERKSQTLPMSTHCRQSHRNSSTLHIERHSNNGTPASRSSTFHAFSFSKNGVKSDRKGMARSRSLDELVFEEVGNTTTATTTAIPPQGRESQPHRHSTTSHPLDMSGREGQQERKSQILPMSTHCRQSHRNSSTLRIEMPTSGGTQANHPSTFLANLLSNGGVKSDRRGMGRSRSLDELVLDEVGDTTTATTTVIPPQGRESQPRRHSTRSLPEIFSATNTTAPNKNKPTPSPICKRKKSVTFAVKRRIHVYNYPTSNTKVADLFYSSSDSAAFTDALLAHACAMRNGIKRICKHDSSYDRLTGLPSPQVLKKVLTSPEDIVGVEHLLCSRGIARSSLALNEKYSQILLESCDLLRKQQRLGSDCNGGWETVEFISDLSRRLRKYSNISSQMAACRAAYAECL
jgi:hypothetical protein